MPDYTITLTDIRNYLTTLAPTDATGDTTSTTACLAAKALQHKYNRKFGVSYDNFGPAEGYQGGYPLGEGVAEVISQFDALEPQFPTREQVEQAIPVLKQEGE